MCISLVGMIALAAIVVFSSGPDFGSIDADHDGCAEVPVIVSHSSNVAKYERTLRQDRPTTASVASLQELPTALTNDSGNINKAPLSERNTQLPSFTPSLRC